VAKNFRVEKKGAGRIRRQDTRAGMLSSSMSDESTVSYCFECRRPLTEIDNRGKRLRGCTICNIWWSVTGGKVRLSEEDLRALHHLMRGKKKPRRG
jgi:hypothetical protein